MNNLKILIRLLYYKIFSRHKYGHGIHSPFVFDLITKVFNDHYKYKAYNEIEKIRSSLKCSENTILFTKYGAGSKKLKSERRKIKDIVKYSSVNKKFGQLLYRLVKYFKPDTILELGTSLGISTMYMAKANKNARVISIEADENLTEIARQNFNKACLQNIVVLNNSFENALSGVIDKLNDILFIFIDGNHEKAPILQYFNQLLVKSDNNWIMVLDDINWSEGMCEAWQEIKENPKVKITLDLFFMGIVCFNKGTQKQNFVIRY